VLAAQLLLALTDTLLCAASCRALSPSGCASCTPSGRSASTPATLRLERRWPLAEELAAAFARLRQLPAPAG
jgi:hypothetical protein